jgi:hypothetical protein
VQGGLQAAQVREAGAKTEAEDPVETGCMPADDLFGREACMVGNGLQVRPGLTAIQDRNLHGAARGGAARFGGCDGALDQLFQLIRPNADRVVLHHQAMVRRRHLDNGGVAFGF